MEYQNTIKWLFSLWITEHIAQEINKQTKIKAIKKIPNNLNYYKTSKKSFKLIQKSQSDYYGNHAYKINHYSGYTHTWLQYRNYARFAYSVFPARNVCNNSTFAYVYRISNQNI